MQSFIPAELAPCGVFCGACPSFHKSCLGCASTDTEQKRTSKWHCKIRACCYQTKALSFCGLCDEFPCTIFRHKLLDTHQDDPRFNYRHELPLIFDQQYDEDLQVYLARQIQRWQCPDCGGMIRFYDYQCDTCQKYHIL